MSSYIAWRNYMWYVVLRQISRNLYCPFFFTRVAKWCLFTILIIWGKGVFPNLNLKMMKVNNKVFFSETMFLNYVEQTLIYPTNLPTECKFFIDFQYFRVDNFRNNKCTQKQVNINDPIFLWWNFVNVHRDDAWVNILHSAKDGDNFCYMWNMTNTPISSYIFTKIFVWLSCQQVWSEKIVLVNKT